MKRTGLIGRRLTHSFSPQIHGMIASAAGEDYEYGLYPLEPEELEGFSARNALDGFNVTIPYKTDVIPFCRRLSGRAAAVGSVNTVLRLPDGGFLGDNTDYFGFERMLGDASAFAGKKALILGSGGASKTVRAVLSAHGIDFVVISRSGEDNYGNLSRHADAQLIVNTTPVGMYPNNGVSPVELSLFPECRLVLDLIYNPAATALLLQARELGIACKNGLEMLVAQGVAAAGLFLGRELPDDMIGRVTSAVSGMMRSITLIGMPGSGKSTVGAALAELTGRRFADTDAMIAERAGMSIPEIFSRFGEARFRELETEALREISKESGYVVATGGGVVTQPRNLPLIRQNSICVFLRRPLGQLSSDGRPVSQSVGVERLYRERLPLYQQWSDAAVDVTDPQTTSKEIIGLCGL